MHQTSQDKEELVIKGVMLSGDQLITVAEQHNNLPQNIEYL